MEKLRHRPAKSRSRLAAACLLLTAASAVHAAAPGLLATHSAAKVSLPCTNVSWLNPPNAPKLLVDVSQAVGTGHCQFEEFSSQNFFALVLGSSPAIATWPTADQVYPASGVPNCGAPVGLGRAAKPTLKQGLPAVIRTLARAKGTAAGTVGDIQEAFGGPLVDQDGRYVQFEIRVDPQMCQVVSSCQFYTTSCVNAVFKSDPDFRFPAGSVAANTPGVAEVKLAWRVMETCNLPDSPPNCKPTDLSKFFTVPNVSVSPYSPTNNGPVTVTLGLTGFHLIQKTPSHPELIWATWEQLSNDPVCTGADNSVCKDPSATASVGTKSGWSYANPPANASSSCSTSSPPPNCANVSYYDSSNPSSQPITQVCRLFPCGGGDQAQMASLNQAIRHKLTASNVWWNYFLVGALWGSGNTSGGNDPSLPNTGSVNLANSTMETYFQANGQNCFTCHNYAADSTFTNLDFTHSLVRAQQAGSTCAVSFNTCAAAGTTPQPLRSSKP